MIRRLLALLAVLVALAPAQAAPPAMQGKVIALTARNQAADSFLVSLFGQAGIRAKVSSSVNRKINGAWRGTPGEIWAQVAAALNLAAFYDGAIIRIYTADEIQTRQFASAAPAAVVREAERLNLSDGNNKVVVSTGGVSATGVPAFLDRIAQIAGTTRAAVQTAALPSGTPLPATAPIMSPLLASDAPIGAVRSNVMIPATARQPYEMRIFYLRYARADDTIQKSLDRTVVIPGVASILRGMMGDGRSSHTVSSSGNFDIARQSQPRLGGRGLSAVPPSAEQTPVDNYGGVLNPPTVVVRETATRDLDGPRIEIDPTQNAVIVRDFPRAMGVYEKLIASLDTEPRIVEIEATILELDVSRLKELGIDFNLQVDGWTGLFGGRAQQPTSTFSDPGIGISNFTGAMNGFSVRINALEKNGSLRVVSRPRLSTLNNLPAVFNNQVQYYVRVAGDRQVDLFPVTAGMELRVKPSVLLDGGVLRTRLDIEIRDGSPTGLVVDGIPAVKQSSINTSAIVPQGESLLIGGMTVDSEFDYKSKVPGLGDIPLLGQAFRKRQKGGQRIERLFLITPRIMAQRQGVSVADSAPSRVVPLEVLEASARGKVRKGRP